MTIAATAAIGRAKTPSVGVIAFAGAIGTIIEWYDFLIYGAAAALVFNKSFFPSIDPRIGVWPRSAPSPSGSWRGRSAARSSAISAIGSAASRC